ncbi:class I SAM-dependent methyltransferase [Desulfonatronovibrio magnus]|uniref:class I SAM-dependent methyltransferase n=1 Tax=Desulfonatronovibrio magnus TaxID=698827 RepID=UPI0005EBD17C|nr:methyltransferase domain-containing protein [Desulfonatronovibrio magnus]
MPESESSMVNSSRILVKLSKEEWILDRAGNLEDLWDQMTGDNPEDEDHIPYWTELWPAAMVLAEHINSMSGRIRGRRCLDIGCGLGLSSLIASRNFADITAMDIMWDALYFTGVNAHQNKTGRLNRVQMDWRHPGFRAKTFDFIWAADVLYEKRFCYPLIDLFRHCLKPHGVIWIADPRRNVSAEVWKLFQQNNFTITELKQESVSVNCNTALVTLMEISLN